MKPSEFCARFLPASVLPRLLAASLGAAAPSMLMAAGQTASPPAPAAGQTHQLFIGLDVHTPLRGQSARVRTVSGRDAELVVDKDVRRIPIREISRFTPKHETKVSTTRIQIANTRVSRASTRLDQTTRDMIVDEAIAEKETKRQESLDRQARAEALAEQYPADAADINAEFERRELVRNIREESPSSQENLFSGHYIAYEDSMRAMDARSAGDEMTFSFELASPTVLDATHVVILAGFKNPSPNAAGSHRVILRPLPPFGSQPLPVSIVEGGIPPGHELESYSIHVYASGHELASNLSAGSVALSRDEATQFMRLKHQREHARTDVGPTAMTDLLPLNFAQGVAANERARRATIKVNAQGVVTSVRLDRLSGANDAYLQSLIREIPFYPAMSEGAPVDGEVTLQLADLML